MWTFSNICKARFFCHKSSYNVLEYLDTAKMNNTIPELYELFFLMLNFPATIGFSELSFSALQRIKTHIFISRLYSLQMQGYQNIFFFKSFCSYNDTIDLFAQKIRHTDKDYVSVACVWDNFKFRTILYSSHKLL